MINTNYQLRARAVPEKLSNISLNDSTVKRCIDYYISSDITMHEMLVLLVEHLAAEKKVYLKQALGVIATQKPQLVIDAFKAGEPYQDLNRCECVCGWAGIVDDLVPTQINAAALDSMPYAHLKDNGDGTLTFMSPVPYSRPAQPKTCEHCKHWLRNGSSGIKSTSPSFTKEGECRNFHVSDCIESYDGGGKFISPESFGCTLFQEKE